MKKFLLLIAIVLPVVLASCGSKDEPLTLEQQLIGGWSNNSEGTFYVFNNDYTGLHTTTITVDGQKVTNTRPITWSLEGNILTINSIGTETYEISINKDVLHMKSGNIFYEFHMAAG